VHADLCVAADGRHSTLRERAGMRVRDLGAPMDVLWFRLARRPDAADQPLGRFGAGWILVAIDRGDYWQCGYVIPKGGYEALRAGGLEAFRERLAGFVPSLAGEIAALASWDEIKLLTVKVDRLERWWRPGFLCIGDAAHAMSPVGGVGINLAIQDAVAAANALAPALLAKAGPIDEAPLRRVQLRRELPTRLIQGLQLQIQKRVIRSVLRREAAPRIPTLLRWLLRFRAVRHLPARLIGYGVRRERVRTPSQATST
jgi:2-polyprenyl-6-methoxyphenol hydroxylase-like FAD-dependent oxidoreductase